MALLAALGGIAFLLLSIVGGARLLLLASRTRQLPELVLGFGLFAMGGIATPAGALARAPLEMGANTPALLLFVQSLIMALGTGGFTLFTQRVFRPTDRWAQALAIALPGAMLAAVVFIGVGPSYAGELANPGPATIVGQLGGLIALAWSGAESLRHARMMKRRIVLGLAEPAVENRLRLWGIAMLLATLMSSATVAAHLFGVSLLNTEAGAAGVGVGGVVAGGALYLAFFPPPFYLRWVTGPLSR